MGRDILCRFLTFCLWCCVSATTIKDIVLKTPELSKLQYYFQKDVTTYELKLGFVPSTTGYSKYTLFAPSNAAFALLPPSFDSQYSPTITRSGVVIEQLEQLLRYHVLQDLVMYEDLHSNTGLPTIANGADKLYCKETNNTKYINGGLIDNRLINLVADNGVVHVIDRVLNMPNDNKNALSYITTSGKYNSFRALLNKYSNSVALGVVSAYDALNSASQPVTVFIPTDAYFSRQMIDINSILINGQLLLKVIQSHVIVNDVWHKRLLVDNLNMSFPALTGNVEGHFFNSSLYIFNQCSRGRIVTPDITLSNGVLHEINGILGYVYSDILGLIEDDPLKTTLSTFNGLARSYSDVQNMLSLPNGATSAPTSEIFTVFVPLNSGFDNADVYNLGDQLSSVLYMHMLSGIVNTYTMTNGSQPIPTLRPNYNAKFYQLIEGGQSVQYVEVNQVRSKIVEADLCAYNGIVHIVDHVVGVPTANLFEAIDGDNSLSTLNQVVTLTGFDVRFRDNTLSFTLFAPSDKAFDALAQNNAGAKLLDPKNVVQLRNVLNRHMISKAVVLNAGDFAFGRTRVFVSNYNGEQLTVSYFNGSFYLTSTFQSRVIHPNIRVKNGIMHVIDEVLFAPADLLSLGGRCMKNLTLITFAALALFLTHGWV